MEIRYIRVGHENKYFSCLKMFLPYILDKTKKSGLLICFLFVFLSIFASNLLPLPKK